MNEVQPIRDKGKIQEIADILKAKNFRNYLMFTVGIYTGLRISDILNLKVVDVRNKEHITVKEKKTRKSNRIYLQPVVRNEIIKYARDKKNEEYLFISRKGSNRPISRVQAYRILTDAAKISGISEIGTHTLRKTFGYQAYKNGETLAIIMKMLNHSKEEHTLRYIGITQDNQDQARKRLRLI